MATVLEDKISGKTTVSETRQEALASDRAPLQERQRTKEYEVVFVVDDSNTSQKAFDFALQTAKSFEASLVLVYATRRMEVPSEYLEYARVEGIRDYGWHYNNDTYSAKLEGIASKAEQAGVEYTTRIHYGDMKSAMNSFVGDVRTIVVGNKSSAKSFFPRSISRLFSKRAIEFGVPVMVL